jgi:L-cysteine desulfidase
VSAGRIVNEGIRVNTELSNAGLEKEIGIGTGYLLHRSSIGSDDLATYIKARTAAAADCRMFGLLLPAMSVAGSGNHGIMATMPIVGYAEKRGINKDLLIEAVTLSYLVTIYATYHSSFLSAACGCATKAGTGAASGLAYYMCNRDNSCCKRSIQNFIANTPGMLCDGAKYGCSLKLATAADAALQSALLAFYHKEVPYTNGILGKSAEESIRNMGEVIKNTMSLDKTILRIMNRKSSKEPLYSSFTR